MPHNELETLVQAALAEDLGSGDVTTDCTVAADLRMEAHVVAKASGVLAGRVLAEHVFRALDSDCTFAGAGDGDPIRTGEVVLRVAGRARALLTGERVALNFLQHLSGIATLTRQYVDAVRGTGVAISDTRKTTPLLRRLEKEAVRCGGGLSHRDCLSARILVKENHLAVTGSLGPTLQKALDAGRAQGLEVEIEVRCFREFDEALRLRPDWILLDHWSPESVQGAVARRDRSPVHLEVSGNLTLENIREFAVPGVEVLSVGRLTHSAPALDLSLGWAENP